MIRTRYELLASIKRATVTSSGMIIGPVAFVGGKHIEFTEVTTECARRALVARIVAARPTSFAPGTRWRVPCSEQTQ